MPDLVTILDALDAFGTLGLAILGLLAFVRGWIVPKAIYDREVRRGDDAIALAGQVGERFDRALDLLERPRRA